MIRWAVSLLCLILPSLATAQQPQSESAPPPGSAIAVPLPPSDQIDRRRYEVPELSGAEVARGSFLIEGRLPRPVADYSATMAGIRQRISLFENGIIAVSMTGTGGTIRKRILIPAEALQQYRRSLDPEVLADLPPTQTAGPTQDRAALRIYRQDGSIVERTFNPMVVQSVTLGKPILILNDVLRVLSEEREISNSLTGYTPKVGDHLIADDEQIYRVVRVLQNGEYVELISTREPLTLYVATKDLHNYFIGKRRAPKRDE